VNIQYKYIGENVRTARLNKGLTIEQLAELADISDSYLGVAERGTSGFSVEVIVRLAAVLDVTTDSLLTENAPNSKPSSKLETLVTLLSQCSDNEIDYVTDFVKLGKKKGIFRAVKP
jgi:transcriptional regulator with XRE-family HTH domain